MPKVYTVNQKWALSIEERIGNLEAERDSIIEDINGEIGPLEERFEESSIDPESERGEQIRAWLDKWQEVIDELHGYITPDMPGTEPDNGQDHI